MSAGFRRPGAVQAGGVAESSRARCPMNLRLDSKIPLPGGLENGDRLKPVAAVCAIR